MLSYGHLSPQKVAHLCPKFTVLIVDDDVTIRWLLCKQLDKVGLHADSAANGREALERLKRWHYRLILMDIHMPEMDGYVATKAIRQMEKDNGIEPVPIIAVTADPDRELCLDAGMTDYTQKPLMADDLRKLITKWMNPESLGIELTD